MTINLRSKYEEFIKNFDKGKYLLAYENNSQKFHKFWKDVILNPLYKELCEEELDVIIRMLDSHAKGHTKEDIAVAATFIRQNMWYRMFFDLKAKPELSNVVNDIFDEPGENKRILLLDKLFKLNESNKNGLTGNSGNIINTLLFINDPNSYSDVCSLKYRKLIIDKFGMGQYKDDSSYGERIISSNKMILSFFRSLGIQDPPFCMGFFLCRVVKDQWINQDVVNEEIIESKVAEEDNQNSFRLEKHFEDFLIANWEKTELGKMYDLLIENGEKISQQYDTKKIGRIDILAKDKMNGDYIVIELKRSQTSDETLGQLLRYMGWVKENLAIDKAVKGIIISHDCDERLKYSVSMVPNAEIFTYQVAFSIAKQN